MARQWGYWSLVLDLTNIDFINVSIFFICIMLAIVFWLAWKTIEHKLHTLAWFLLYVFAAVNGVLNALNDLFPDRDVYWVLVNAISLLTQWLALIGYRSRSGRDPFNRWVIAWFIGVELLVVLFTFIVPHMGLKMVMIPWSGGLVLLAIAWTVYHSGRRTRPAELTAIILFVLYAGVQFSSGTVALMQGAELDQHYLDLYLMINFLFMPAAFTGMGLFTLLIVVDDLGARLRRQARTDQLTGLKNRRGFGASARHYLKRARRKRQPVSIIVCDLDHFKEVNDRHGHLAGDAALKSFADLLTGSVDDDGIAARVGGEEFAVMLYGMNSDQAANFAEQIRSNLSQRRISHDDAEFTITASFGISQVDLGSIDLNQVLGDADQALYQAKASGRDCVLTYAGLNS